MDTRSNTNGNAKRNEGMVGSIRAALCLFMAALLAFSMAPLAPQAEAAQYDPKAAEANQPSVNVFMTLPDGRTADVTKVVMTLNGADNYPVKFEVKSSASPSSARYSLIYDLVDVDEGNNDKLLTRSSSPKFEIPLSKLVTANNPQVRIMETRGGSEEGSIIVRKQLNIRIADVKKVEAQINKSGGWSISNGLNLELKGTSPGGFFKDMKLIISPISLPVTYKHNPDGTTIVGINCNANDLAFYKAVKNKNIWQKYSDQALEKMAKGISKGMSGKGVGTWGGKGIDWSIAGFAEFNTKDPTAPWNVTLVGTVGIKYSQSAQYFCLTGTVTGGVGAKFLGSVIRNPKANSYSGYIDAGGYGTLELFGGLGAGTIAAVGIYGRGRLEAMFGLVPTSNFGFKSVSVSGDAGLKAVAFGFDIVRWVILEPKNSPYYIYDRDKKKKAPSANAAPTVKAESSQGGISAPAPTLADVDADAAYPELPRDYLSKDSSWAGEGLAAGSSDELSTQADTLVKNIYGAADLVCAETKSGPVVAYIADAEQVGVKGRDAANRSVLVYSRYQSNGTWTKPKPIDVTDAQYGKTPDYNPAIYASPDSDDFYVTWLDANSEVAAGTAIGEISKKLDVRFALVGANDTVTTSTVMSTLDKLHKGHVNGSPSVYVDKVGKERVAYVGWSTNEGTGNNGQVVGTSGDHFIYLKSHNLGELKASPYWNGVESASEKGAVTSLSVGKMSGTPMVAWSVDKTYADRCKKNADGTWSTVSLSDLTSLKDSAVYKLTEDNSSQTLKPKVEKVVDNATAAQFITVSGEPTLAYTTWARADESGNFCSVYNAKDKSLILDGTKVGLPTPEARVYGDAGGGAQSSMVTCARTNKAAGIAALVKKGKDSKDWGTLVDATDAKTDVTSYGVVYHNGAPMVIYTAAASASKALSAQSDDSSGDSSSAQADESYFAADLEVASGDALRDVDVLEAHYDEMAVDAGQVMPVSVDYVNDGVLPLKGVDVYTYNEETDDKPVLRASTDDAVQPGDEGSASFELQLPEASAFTHDLRYYLLTVPKGATGVTAKTIMEKGSDASLNFELGDPHLALETEHRLVDGQESVVAVIKNEGAVTSKPATLVYEQSESGIDLERIDVPALAENETFEYEYKAPREYFQNTSVDNMTIMLEDPNDPDDAYSLYNSDSIYTWEIDDDEAPAGNATKADTTNTKSNASTTPKTGDSLTLCIVLALLALIVIASPVVTSRIRKARKE